jgi:hypothetical protein
MIILGRAGDTVKCEDGHALYKLLNDIETGTRIGSAVFEPIGDAQIPVTGERVKPCHICGKPWLKRGPRGGFLPVRIET